MGREQRRKQAKKEGKSLQKPELNQVNKGKKLIKIIIGLVIFMSMLYIILGLFVTKELDWLDKEETTNTTTSSNTILASSIFKQSEEEYYVYFYDFNEEDSDISSAINTKLASEKVYKVDTSSSMNSNYVSESSNKNATTLDELKVLSPTVIKIVGDNITEYYENEEILNNLK